MIDAHALLSVFHIFFVSPLFLAVGYMRSNTPTWLYWILLGLGCIVFVYHTYKFMLRRASNSSLQWINLIHMLFVAPLMVYVGYNQKMSMRFGYELLLMLGFASFGYHLFSLVRALQTNDTKSVSES